MAMTITAAVAPGTGEPLTIQQLQLDDLRPDEVRVRMVATGICHTDAIVRDGIYPTPLRWRSPTTVAGRGQTGPVLDDAA